MTTTHSLMLPYKMTGSYVLVVSDGTKNLSGRPQAVSHRLTNEKIAQMQRAGALADPLPAYRHTIGDYIMGYLLWLAFPLVFVFTWLFSMLGIGSSTRGETRPA